jgi:hypothetical protein
VRQSAGAPPDREAGGDGRRRDPRLFGDIVLDAFLGSGTTMIVAERTGRRCDGWQRAAKVTKSCRSFPFRTAVSLAMPSRCPFVASSACGLRSWKQIQRLIINMSHAIDLIEVIFHPTRCRRPTASLDGSWVE